MERCPDSMPRVRKLVSVNAAAEGLCISQEEVAEITKLAAFISKRAASHVERLISASVEEDLIKAQ